MDIALGVGLLGVLFAFALTLFWAVSVWRRDGAARDGEQVRRRELDALERQLRERDAALEVRTEKLSREFGTGEQKLERIAGLDREIQLMEQDRGRRAQALSDAELASSSRLAELRRSVESLEAQAEGQAAGFYRLRYDFGTSKLYQQRLDEVRARERQMIKDGTAAVCRTQWTVSGNEKEGAKLVRDEIKLMLRAFNGACDAAVLEVRYNNIEALEKRIRADYEAINKLGQSKQCELTTEYLSLKLEELHLVFEFQERKRAEAEEQRAIREQMRDDERAQREIERAKEEADRDARREESALARARADVEHASGKAREALEMKVAELEARLAETRSKQKAISQAQLTTRGHVYVISNVGSFGEGVYKIGMTRRLHPQERVDELGDASVPFPFDVHAMVQTEDAPDLERQLHQVFRARQVNRVNERKEFFRVELGEVEAVVRRIVGARATAGARELEFTLTASAEEYRRSIAIEQADRGV